MFKFRELVILLFVAMSLSFDTVKPKVQVVDLVCEYLKNPIGIDVNRPRLSWKLVSDGYDIYQTAYEIRVAGSLSDLKSQKALYWSPGKVKSDQSVNVNYEGKQLNSGERAYWQVRIWDEHNNPSKWSEPAFWEMGLLNTDEWSADWITMGKEDIDRSLPSHYYRYEFGLNKKIKSARVYVTSLGLYQLYVNGQKVGNDLFTPGWTSYNNRVLYQTYDITPILSSTNAIGAIVGDGWYRGYLGWSGDRAYYGDQLALLAQVHIEYEDGTTEKIGTNTDWKTTYGPILKSDIYNGETYDANQELEGWSSPDYDQLKWKNVQKLDHPKSILEPTSGIPVRITEELQPVKKIITPKGEVVFDLGQNIVGWVRMKVKGDAGDQVTLKFAETLDKEGNFYTVNLRDAEATDRYILKGGEEEIFEPHFTFHGFRYIKVEGFPGTPTAEDFTGVVIHSDMKSTGTFECSNPLVNKLQSNIRWSQRDNFLDIPTDCPQRDERLGWTGDAQVFSMTAAFNFDVAAFYRKWLKDLAADQQPDGGVPNVIPDMLDFWRGGATGWGDAAVIIPWTVYKVYGDERILTIQYESMKGWVDYVKQHAGDDFLWNEEGKHQWGDWLSFHSKHPGYSGAFTEKDLIATAYFKYSAEVLGKAAAVLGRSDDAVAYKELAEKVKEAFIKEYITSNGRLVSHTQTAYAMALSFDLVPENLREKAAQYLVDDVKQFGHLTTGFLGTPLLCSTLSDVGRDDLAYMLLNRKNYPGWLYPVTQGATTMWERWDTQKPDGTIIEGMNSFNHYAYGAIGEWLYSHVAGLELDEKKPGYKHTIFNPHPGGGLTSAKATIESVYGQVVSDWEIKDGQMIYRIVIPPNAQGTVELPNLENREVSVTTSNGKSIDLKNGYQSIGSGEYIFRYAWE